jgi:hypothetical protein
MTGFSRRGLVAGAGALAGAIASGVAGGARASASGSGTGRELALLQTHVAGAHRPEVRRIARQLTNGAPLILKREPENDYDPRAVSVWTQCGNRLGYVPRIHNQALANLMDAGLAPHAQVDIVGGDPMRADVRVEITLPLA